MNSALIKGNSQDIEEFACLLEKEGRKRNNKDKNAVCLVTYEKSTDINLFEVYNTWLGSSNKVLFTLPEDKAKAYKHLFGKELGENTPKFKVGDSVSYLGQNCTIRGFTKNGTGIMVEGYSNGHSGSFNEWYYDENGEMQDLQVSTKSDRHYTTLKEIQLIKSTNTNMKYKVIKWYPGCEVTKERVGEVIETSNDYSTAEYREFYEEVKVNSLEEAVKASGLKIGDYLDNQKVEIYSEHVASSKEKERHTLTNHGNLVCTNVKVLEFAMIQNVPCARIMYTSESDVWVAISDLKTVPKPEMYFSNAGFDYTEAKDYVKIGCQRYTLEDTKAFILTMNRAELDVLSFRSGRLPVTKQQIMYVHNLLNK